jgi:hypothetical protein
MKNTKNYVKSPMAWAVAASLIFVPATALAKTNNLKANPDANQATTTCPTKAFGHLFAPGWLKRNSKTTVPAGCLLPYGIAKKLGIAVPGTGTTTDAVAPAISSIVVTPGATTAMVTWNTNEAADSAVFFSASLPVNTSATATQTVSSPLGITTHSLRLQNLATSTTYYAVVRARDAAGNVTFSSPVSFVTGTSADMTAPVVTDVVTIVGTSTLRFTWNTSELSTSKVFFSTTTPVNVTSTSTPFVENLSLSTNHSMTLSGLMASTTYRIVIQSKDSSSNTGSVTEFPVTTSQ